MVVLAVLALFPGMTLSSAYRFDFPVAVQLITVEPVACARPLTGTSSAEGGRCLNVDLAVTHRDRGGRIEHAGASYLLERGFVERIALDFGAYAPVVLRELGRGIEAADVEQQPGLEPVARRALKQIDRYVHYRVLPHVSLPMDIEMAVAQLAQRYYLRARRPLVITSGPRTPESQAMAMYLKLIQGASLRRLYRKTRAAQEIHKAYDAGRHARKRHGAIIADMAEVIRQQIRQGVYVSPHLKGGAVDIRSRRMGRAAKAALQRAVASFHGMRLIREEKVPPHFHLELKPVD